RDRPRGRRHRIGPRHESAPAENPSRGRGGRFAGPRLRIPRREYDRLTVTECADAPDALASLDESAIVVIGGGIVGLCIGRACAADGHAVAVLDRGAVGVGCAWGSAGHLVPSHVVPLAAPGAPATAARALLRRDGPLSARLSPEVLRWLLRFSRSCRSATARSATTALKALADLSMRELESLLAQRPSLEVRREGVLDVYRSDKALLRALRAARAAEEAGITVEVLDRDEASELEPALRPPVAGAVFYPDDSRMRPADLLAELRADAQRRGAVLVPGVEVLDLVARNSAVETLTTTAGDVDARHVIIAAGAWSGRLARMLGTRLPVLAARGMSVTYERPADGPRRALLLGEDHVAVGVTDSELRLSGWFQLGAESLTPSLRRLEALERLARRRLRLDSPLRVLERWAGLRPTAPDGVPIIGAAPQWRNVTIATGHAMIGLTMALGTGRLVADLVSGTTPALNAGRFSPARLR
ncbi:MAG: FAD-dependent oxidoreductase, partial [Acidimicrobiia bacterium]|nr:FAD-dependent oxidoreductase [Acidimicrobiia bacterium]